MSKTEYRTMFCEIKDYVKFKPFLLNLGISQSCFSYFLKGPEYDMMISLEKLEMLRNNISNYFMEKVV